MASHNDTGVLGEKLAVEWLKTKDYTILHCNWNWRYYEIDIIAAKNKTLHFIEVKTRHGWAKGNPEDSVGKNKMKYIRRAADQYLFQNPNHPWIQFDILSIKLYDNKPPEYFLLEDVSFFSR